MGTASAVDLSVNPFVETYTGPKRFSPNLPKVVELVQVEDFEATLSWVIGMNGAETTVAVQVVSNPTRVVVDVSHTEEIVHVNAERSPADGSLRTARSAQAVHSLGRRHWPGRILPPCGRVGNDGAR